jgi:4-amino-4-deoxy-L-arabinose transferase-like glycosyltransferase
LDLEPGIEANFLTINPAVDTFIYENRIPGDALIDRARLPFLVLPVLLGAVVFAWAAELHGPWGGLLALALTVFNPALLGQAGFANHDFGLATFSVTALWALWRLCRAPSLGWTVAAGVALGLALASKYTAAMLVPTMLLLGLADVFVRSDGTPRGPALARRAGHLGAVVLIAGLVVWADYGFRVGPLPIDRFRFFLSHINPDGIVAKIAARLPDRPVVPAPDFVNGVAVQMIHGDTGHVNYLLGRVSASGWWYYYLLTFLWRVPLALFALVGLWLATRGDRPADAWATTWLLLYGVFTVLLFSASPTQLGERYVLVVYPLLFVVLGGLARRCGRAAGAVGLCLAAYVATSLAAYPDYLTYFNRLAGGPDAGFRKVVEGVDLGQDARGLQRFVEARGIAAIKLSCFGCAPLRSLGPAFQPLGCAPTTGWLAVSIRQLVMPEPFLPRGCFDWLATRPPAARIGHSIWVWNVPPGAA